MPVITITYDWNHSLSNKNFKNHKGDVMRRRKTEEINKAWDKLYELVWYKRHILYHGRWHDQYLNSGDQTKIDIANKAVAEAKRIEEQYKDDPDFIQMMDENFGDYHYARLEGRLAMVRWIFGDEWDDFDS